MNFNQVACDTCWERNNPGRTPFRMIGASTEHCSWCGQPTTSGIFVRIHPREVPFPQPEDVQT